MDLLLIRTFHGSSGSAGFRWKVSKVVSNLECCVSESARSFGWIFEEADWEKKEDCTVDRFGGAIDR